MQKFKPACYFLFILWAFSATAQVKEGARDEQRGWWPMAMPHDGAPIYFRNIKVKELK